MSLLTGKTAVYGIFGAPVAHSLSPVMQNAAFKYCGIDAVYVPFHVHSDDISMAVASVRALDIKGINVTVPHKEAVIPFLDDIDPVAAVIGAVNTVVNRKGRLVGYNTDSSGFLRAAGDELGFNPLDQQILLLGAGGACRAAVYALLSAGAAKVTVANRSLARARTLVAAMPVQPHQRLLSVAYGTSEYFQELENAHLIVNTTSVGLYGEKLDFLPLENIKSSALIFDMVYSETGTALTNDATSRGLSCVDGLDLLAAQGEDAFFIWTKKRLPTGFMRSFLTDYQSTCK